MEIIPLGIEGVWLAKSPVWSDGRGSFSEWFKSKSVVEKTKLNFSVEQANFSESKRGVVRGIHYSLASTGQAKWVTCLTGSIKDVVLDIRISSKTYGKYITIDLVGGDGRAVLIGTGLGHGFVSLVDGTIVSYLVTTPFSPTEEFEINPLDPEIGIDWGLSANELILSAKDSVAPCLSIQKSQGKLPI